ncbi:hypothetical protein [Bradyrhizobium sp.]|nr:hypothetical protein [Bradyrhizobium sp.]
MLMFFHGTLKHHVWEKPGDEIPQPTSVIMGKNDKSSHCGQQRG